MDRRNASTGSRLSELKLLHAYRKGDHDIANEFYLPCFARSVLYRRAVGFFSSSIFAIAWPSLRQFVAGGGKIELICSPVLSDRDQAALEEGHDAAIEHSVAVDLRDEVRRLLDDPYLCRPTRILASLVATDILSIKIAFMLSSSDQRARMLFHDKVGIFEDRYKNRVAFKGSMNETWAGLSADGNLESVDVFVSWGGTREETRIADEQNYFERLWRNMYPSVAVRDFPQIARSELINSADPANWQQLLEDVCNELEIAAELSPDQRTGGRIPRPHQVQALLEWAGRGRRGILKHATASGKTFTAMCAIKQSLERGETPIIVVPSQILMDQWADEIQTLFEARGTQLLMCDARSNWRHLLGPWTRPGNDSRIVLASMSTAATADFLNRIRQGEHLFLIADEVHGLGAPTRRNIMALQTGPRLGLSATPERAGDPLGTAAILDYFCGIVPPPYPIGNAIRDGTLCPYTYHIHAIELLPIEQRAWDDLTARIQRLSAQGHATLGAMTEISETMRSLLLRRARIMKRAALKIGLAHRVLLEHYRPGQRWLVYCDSREQLGLVVRALTDAALPVMEYHTGMSGDRSAALRYFSEIGGILVAIKCLDEGVDIPAIDHALILASSKNPREFIQRRGRVLRTHEGKRLAVIHDALVVPNAPRSDDYANRMLVGEFARALEFGRTALNPGSITDVELLAHEFGFDLQSIRNEGVEEDNGA